MVDGVESEGNDTEDKGHDLCSDDIKMGGVAEEQPKWKPRPVAEPIEPIGIGSQTLFISKEKFGRVTKSWEINTFFLILDYKTFI